VRQYSAQEKAAQQLMAGLSRQSAKIATKTGGLVSNPSPDSGLENLPTLS
jgi:hypothetical protein